MIIYWINLTMIPIWAFLFKIINIKSKRILLLVLFTQLYLILALRSPKVGGDVYGYINIFERVKESSFLNFEISRHEPGYIFLNKLLSFIDNQQIFIAVIAFISLFLFYLFIKQESKIVWLSVFLFISIGIYTSSFLLFRQIIAMGLVANSYRYVKEGNAKKFFCLNLIASLFHVTALGFLPIYFLRKVRLNSRTYLIYIGLLILFLLFGSSIIKVFVSIFGTIDYDLESEGGLGYLLILAFILFFGLYFKNSIQHDDPNATIMYHILMLGLLIQILAFDFHLMTRVTRYFSMFIIIFVPNIISSIRNKKLVVLGIYSACCLSSVLYYKSLNTDLSSIVPYEFFF